MAQEMSTTQLINEIEKGMRAFKAFEEGLAAVKKLASLEQNLAETEARLAKATSAENEANKIREDAKAYASVLQKEAVDEKRSAESERKEVLEDARKRAAKIIDDAKAEAAKVKSDGEKALADLGVQAAEIKNANEGLRAGLEADRKELEDIQAALGKHKAQLEKFLK